MILDSSAIVSLFLKQPGFEGVVKKLASAERVAVGTPTLVETGIVIQSRTGLEPRALLDRFVADFEVETIEFSTDHWREALAAFRRYGKGRHPAALNFGDCLTYATARLSEEPLLFLGDDFSRTDLPAA
jgi:ribonuclease VapC